jgi:hypothetical protein
MLTPTPPDTTTGNVLFGLGKYAKHLKGFCGMIAKLPAVGSHKYDVSKSGGDAKSDVRF